MSRLICAMVDRIAGVFTYFFLEAFEVGSDGVDAK